MANYRLLRNNKESGPFTLDEIVGMGLKPYDLIWVEGRSAAWRYPSEIEDLKSFAPVVEEQPYDRFFKKPEEINKKQDEQLPANPVISITVPLVKSSILKQVFISMPAKNGGAPVKTVVPIPTPPLPPVSSNETDHSRYLPSAQPQIKPPPQQTISREYVHVPKADDEVETRYSQSLDDIKEMYSRNLVDRKLKSARRKMFQKVATRAMPFLVVLIAGFALGMFLNNKKAVKKDTAVNTKAIDNKNSQAVEQTASPNSTQSITQKHDEQNTTSIGVAGEKQLTQQQVPMKKPQINTTVAKRQNPIAKLLSSPPFVKRSGNNSQSKENIIENYPHKDVVTDPQTGSRGKVSRAGDVSQNDAPVSTESFRAGSQLLKQVSVFMNDYKRGTFGGIHDLQISVANNSNYLLDRVVVQLDYLKPSEEPLKSDFIPFTSIPPHTILSIAVPPSNRGIKVACRITHIDSKQMNSETANR